MTIQEEKRYELITKLINKISSMHQLSDIDKDFLILFLFIMNDTQLLEFENLLNQ